MTLTRRALLTATAAVAAGIRSIPARLRGSYGTGRYGRGRYGRGRQ